jgi:enoyl-[acyl-carrier protein] reductase/trans-2-enoyl-CoA reductase (NAD+)
VIGASTGYGLASRIAAGFGCQAATIGVFFEKEPEKNRTATAGWYNSVAFARSARGAGLYAKSFNGDGFSDEMRARVCETIQKDLKQVDLVVYSLAAPRRQNPRTGVVSKSVLKPIAGSFADKSINMSTDRLETVSLPAATQDEIDQTVAVMGGEDWSFWMEALEKENLLAKGAMTVAYSYIGPELTTAIYRNGTIGKAKAHLENTARELDKKMKSRGGRALISVNKALVTQSSSAIPFIPLYFILLSKVMKAKGLEEDCIAQIDRMFRKKLYVDPIDVDENGFIRMDDWETLRDVQETVNQNWQKLTESNLKELADLDGYHAQFLKLFGFGLPGVDYSAEVDPDLKLPSQTDGV